MYLPFYAGFQTQYAGKKMRGINNLCIYTQIIVFVLFDVRHYSMQRRIGTPHHAGAYPEIYHREAPAVFPANVKRLRPSFSPFPYRLRAAFSYLVPGYDTFMRIGFDTLAKLGAVLCALVIVGCAVFSPPAAHAVNAADFERALQKERDFYAQELSDRQAAIRRLRLEANLVQLLRGVDRKSPLLEVISAIVLDGESYSTAITAKQKAIHTSSAAAEKTIALLSDAQRRLAAFSLALHQEQRRRASAAAGAPANLLPDEATYGWGGDFSHGVSARSIDDYLRSQGSPMAGNGEAFLRAGLQWNIDPRLIVAIAGAESSFGRTTCASHNAWGWGCPTSPFSFASWEAGIDAVTKGIRTGYVDDGLTSVLAIHQRYAPPGAANDPTALNDAWAVNVAEYLAQQGGNPENIEAVRARTGSTGLD